MSIFSQVPTTRIARSRHNLSHQVKMSFDAGKINPLLCELARPGDTWRVGLEQFVRTMPMIAPLMDRMDIKVDSFFVPLRLIWDDFEDFITLGPTGEFSALRPTISVPANSIPSVYQYKYAPIFGIGGMSDYLNFPPFNLGTDNSNEAIKIDALPFRSYQIVYNEYFRNEVLDVEIPIAKSSGDLQLVPTTAQQTLIPASSSNFELRSRGWNKDYFTSALPTPQKGPAVRIPYGDIEVTSDGEFLVKEVGGNPPDPSLSDITLVTKDVPTRVTYQDGQMQNQTQGFGALRLDTTNPNWGKAMEYFKGLKANMDASDLPTIEELRYAEVLQEFYEANARGGTRAKEYYQNIWHTRTKDARLDRPEYLGGYRGPITISDIDQNSESAVTPQGTLAGKGVSAGGNRLLRYHVPEWGIILIVMSVVPKSSYYQGFRKWNLYNDVFDWPNPFFANLGEQEILNKELYHSASDNDDDDTFGYTPRYAECKFIPSSVHGQFRSTLDYWHLSRKFGSRPHLNSAFLHIQQSEVERAFPLQVSDSNKFLGTFFFHIDCKMYLPYWGVPRLIHSI